ncbi:uncharacterized protein STEHIDRAFT_147043 [Stereum hirsutum FP-91666 SS1]|uniref:uncharacterized protein n=1 Tax=Stereum hirsutum (strain FP-91666) TaxID=721885 RepID=UPI000440D774|nr:uncharacterized protein STEHIDRAFT_147043 [Stereum hirsutum FP-91666 SS1]EIM86424.1 hypothetical protein STEHIDRAFT_147043 [Stereum hirsutum FP-91666 SS1]
MNDPAVATLAAKYFSSESAEEIEVLDPFNMFGCGPSMDKKWIAIVKSDPKRTVAIFDIPLGSSAKSGVHIGTSNHEKGDTRADICPAIRAIVNSAVQWTDRSAWEGLVRAGVVEKLCKCVSGTLKTIDYPPGTPKALKDKIIGQEQLKSPYHIALAVFAQTLERMQRLGGVKDDVDKIIVSTLEKHWGAMVARLWRDPSMTSREHNHHSVERTLLSRLVMALADLDSSFRQTLCTESDLTVAVAVRYWMHATQYFETQCFYHIIETVYFPTDTESKTDTGTQQNQALFLSSILKATNDVPSRFFAAWGKQLKVFTAIDVPPALDWLKRRLWMSAYGEQTWRVTDPGDTAAFPPPISPPVITAFIKSRPFWQTVFDLLRRTDCRGMLYLPVLNFLSFILFTCAQCDRDELPTLLRVFGEVDFFGTLEAVLPLCLPVSGVHAEICKIFSTLLRLAQTHPPIISVLRSQLPRPRTYRLLFDDAYKVTGSLPPRLLTRDVVLPTGPSRPGIDDTRGWWWIAVLQHTCADEKQCGRRGCTEKGGKKCKACMGVGYCGAVCQKMDWKEHRLACGLSIDFTDDSLGFDELGILSVPETFRPYREGDLSGPKKKT